MRVLGILWNGMQEHLEEALNDISKYGDIKDAFTLNLGESYESFVRDIYAQDTIAEWKVNKKSAVFESPKLFFFENLQN